MRIYAYSAKFRNFPNSLDFSSNFVQYFPKSLERISLATLIYVLKDKMV